jgi:SAM-dependent methyltransferase
MRRIASPISAISDDIFQKMRLSPLITLVGGGDPKTVGETNFALLDRFVNLANVEIALDFGCGIGRTTTIMLERMRSDQRIIGLDILPHLIQFCKVQIGARYSNAEFICTDAKNPHYTAEPTAGVDIVPEDSVIKRLSVSVDLLCAFSVITHMTENDISSFFVNVSRLLRPKGKALVTVFLLDEESRQSMRFGSSPIGFSSVPGEHDTYFATRDDLDFVAISYDAIRKIILSNGLKIDAVTFGNWRGIEPRGVYDLPFRQDCLLIQKPLHRALPVDFDGSTYLALNPDVAAAGVDPGTHYLWHGTEENRRYK